MLDRRFVPPRARPMASAPGLPGPVHVTPLAPAARFSLRIHPSAGIDDVGGLCLDQPINRYAHAGDRWSARLGPDEWLIGGPEADADLMQTEIETALGDVAHALVDVSHRNVAFEIAGPDAAAALNAGCPLDLHESVFPAGAATRTLLGKAEIVLVRAGAEPRYLVECWRSFAPYVHGFLVEAVWGLGIEE